MVDFAKALKDRKADVLAGRICPYCGAVPEKVDSAEVYGGRSYGPILLCRPCGAYVGFHKNSDKPLGRLADAQLREAKKKAHACFDALWQAKMKKGASKPIARGLAYKWLAKEMGLPQEECHIGMMDVHQCEWVVELCAPWVSKLKA